MTTTDYEGLRSQHATQPIPKTMMDVPLRVTDIMKRAELLFPDQEVISRFGPGHIVRHTYKQLAIEARQLASVLAAHGIQPGMRVATLMWNHATHLTAYYGVPAIGAVLHPLNPRLSAEELAYIVADAGDSALLIDDDLLELWQQVSKLVQIPLVIVNRLSDAASVDVTATGQVLNWQADVSRATPLASWPSHPLDETEPVSVCYTSGTTGRPKGVVYSHRSIMLHSMTVATPDALNISGRDTVLTLTPMFHVNAWSMPYTAVMLGARQVLAGPRASATEIACLMAEQHVTTTLGVPTIWNDVLNVIESNQGRWSFAPGMRVYSGGAAPSAEMFRRFDRLDMKLQTGWGMTEVSPMGSQTWIKASLDQADEGTLLRTRTSNGIALPLVDMRHVNDHGDVQPWDGQSVGELQVRGPWVTRSYIGHPSTLCATTADGWLKTGDIVCFEANGYMRLVDRLKDLVKSGGEWISSVDMENALCDHPSVGEAAVIAVADERWGERPLAAVVLKPGMTADANDIRAHIADRYPKWMVPEHIELVSQLPKTSVGKLNKQALRKQFSPVTPQ